MGNLLSVQLIPPSYSLSCCSPFTCFVRTQCEYRLAELNCCLAQTCYEPSKHSALIIRHASPSCRLKVYDNGNISCQGYSYESAAQGIQCFIGTMEKLGYTPVFHSPRFNVVNATFSMHFDINLKALYRNYRDECLYNAEAHPYLIFNVSKWSIKLAIFAMGYVCVLLASQPTATHKAIAFILPILYGHRMMTGRISSGQQQEEVEQGTKLQSGDITFKLLWEHEFQKAYQDTLKCARWAGTMGTLLYRAETLIFMSKHAENFSFFLPLPLKMVINVETKTFVGCI